MIFILEGVVLRGVEGRVWLGVVIRGVFYGAYFRVFRLYMTLFVCIL